MALKRRRIAEFQRLSPLVNIKEEFVDLEECTLGFQESFRDAWKVYMCVLH